VANRPILLSLLFGHGAEAQSKMIAGYEASSWLMRIVAYLMQRDQLRGKGGSGGGCVLLVQVGGGS